MNDPFQVVFTLAALAASALAWVAIGRKILRRDPLVPYAGRCPVPWKAVDVAAIFGLYFLPMLVGLAIFAFQALSNGEATAAPEISQLSTTEAADADHAVIVLLRQDGTPLTWMLCLVAAVIVAPVAEEFLFRLVLQGWLEAVEHRWRGSAMRPLARGAEPILISSILFAAIHFRLPEPAGDPDQIKMALLFQIVWSPLVVVHAVAWLRLRAPDLSAVDLGINPRRIKSDIGLGLVAFLAVACLIYLLQFVLRWLWPNVVADPISLFFFALVLGFLYFRTHRLLPSIVLHMALNGVSLWLVWLSLSQPAGS